MRERDLILSRDKGRNLQTFLRFFVTFKNFFEAISNCKSVIKKIFFVFKAIFHKTVLVIPIFTIYNFKA